MDGTFKSRVGWLVILAALIGSGSYWVGQFLPEPIRAYTLWGLSSFFLIVTIKYLVQRGFKIKVPNSRLYRLAGMFVLLFAFLVLMKYWGK